MHPTGIDATTMLVVEYLDVCNTALEANRNTFPYRQLFAVYGKIFSGKHVGCLIFEDDPGKIEFSVTIQMTDGQFEPVPETEAHPSFNLKIKRSYMEGVVRHRQEYIDHPEKLDWDWLKSRLGMEPQHKDERS